MNDYPVDVPTGAISSLVRILRAERMYAEAREFARSCWIVRGFLLRAAIGVPAAADEAARRSMPTITPETQTHFHELHGLLGKSMPDGDRNGITESLVESGRVDTFKLLDLWLGGTLPLDPGPVAVAIAEIRVFDPAQAKVDSEFGIGAAAHADETAVDQDEQREAA